VSRRWIAAAALAGVAWHAAPVRAQGAGYPGGGFSGGEMHGGGRGRGNRGGALAPDADPHLVALAKTIAADPADPIPLVLAERGSLGLADSQMVALSGIESRLAMTNGPLRARLDALRPPGDTTVRPDFAHLTTEERDSIIALRSAVAHTRGQMRDNDLQARGEALSLLTTTQRAQVLDLEQRVRAVMRGAASGTTPRAGRGDSGGDR
jgi:hypothetical protein